jgi:hypothetical protein
MATPPERNIRELLKAIGVGNVNASGIIQYAWMAPATTDPRSGPIIIMVQGIQQMLQAMGAEIRVSGYLDTPTAAALERIVGPQWEQISWAANIGAILAARKAGMSAAPTPAAAPAPQVISAQPPMGLFDFLPEVPGGLLTYAVGAVIAWHYLHKRPARIIRPARS